MKAAIKPASMMPRSPTGTYWLRTIGKDLFKIRGSHGVQRRHAKAQRKNHDPHAHNIAGHHMTMLTNALMRQASRGFRVARMRCMS